MFLLGIVFISHINEKSSTSVSCTLVTKMYFTHWKRFICTGSKKEREQLLSIIAIKLQRDWPLLGWQFTVLCCWVAVELQQCLKSPWVRVLSPRWISSNSKGQGELARAYFLPLLAFCFWVQGHLCYCENLQRKRREGGKEGGREGRNGELARAKEP